MKNFGTLLVAMFCFTAAHAASPEFKFFRADGTEVDPNSAKLEPGEELKIQMHILDPDNTIQDITLGRNHFSSDSTMQIISPKDTALKIYEGTYKVPTHISKYERATFSQQAVPLTINIEKKGEFSSEVFYTQATTHQSNAFGRTLSNFSGYSQDKETLIPNLNYGTQPPVDGADPTIGIKMKSNTHFEITLEDNAGINLDKLNIYPKPSSLECQHLDGVKKILCTARFDTPIEKLESVHARDLAGNLSTSDTIFEAFSVAVSSLFSGPKKQELNPKDFKVHRCDDSNSFAVSFEYSEKLDSMPKANIYSSDWFADTELSVIHGSSSTYGNVMANNHLIESQQALGRKAFVFDDVKLEIPKDAYVVFNFPSKDEKTIYTLTLPAADIPVASAKQCAVKSINFQKTENAMAPEIEIEIEIEEKSAVDDAPKAIVPTRATHLIPLGY